MCFRYFEIEICFQAEIAPYFDLLSLLSLWASSLHSSQHGGSCPNCGNAGDAIIYLFDLLL